MVLDKMKDILVEQLECNPEDITMESLLVDDLGADSLDAIDIVMSVEDTFKVEVPDEIIEKIETVRHGYVRRAKLYYLRDRVGKAAKIREKL